MLKFRNIPRAIQLVLYWFRLRLFAAELLFKFLPTDFFKQQVNHKVKQKLEKEQKNVDRPCGLVIVLREVHVSGKSDLRDEVKKLGPRRLVVAQRNRSKNESNLCKVLHKGDREEIDSTHICCCFGV